MYRDTDYLNYNDLNKVENELKQENEKLTKLNPSTPTFFSKEWKENDFPYIQEIDRIERGVNELAKNYYEPEGWQKCKTWLEGNETSQVIKSFSYKDINRWINNYNLIKEKLDTYKTKIIKGTRIEVNSVKNQNSSKFTIYGTSEQETRSGKNKFGLKEKSNATSYGLTYSVSNNEITINGTATASDRLVLCELINPLTFDSSKNYIITAFPTGSVSNTGWDVQLRTNTSNIISIVYDGLAKTSYNIKNKSDTATYLGFYIATGTTFTNFKIKFQIEEGDVATDYEPYRAMPSPDYPSEIKNIDGIRNLYNYEDKNTVVNATVDNDGWITMNYDNTSGTSLKYCNYFTHDLDLLTDTNYNIITEIKDISYVLGTGNLYLTSSQTSTNAGQFLAKTYKISNLTSNSIIKSIAKTKTSFDNVSNVGLRTFLEVPAGDKVSITFRISVLEDTTITSETFVYVPYGSNYLPIVNTGKNKFDGEYELGTINFNTGQLETNTNIIRTKNYQKIIENENYSLSLPLEVTGIILYYYKNGVFVKANQPVINNHSVSFTTPSNANQIKWRFNSGYTALDNETQLEEGSVSTNYEPYRKQTTLIDLKGNELCSIGDVRDELEVVSGKGIQRIGKVVLDGSEKWISHSYGTNSYSLKDVLTFNFDYTQIQLISNYFKGVSNRDRTIGDNIIYTISSREFVIRNTTFTSLSDFKTWLSNNPVTLYYILKEEQPFEIKPTNIKLFEGYNNIELLTDVDTEMECEYIYEIGDKTTIWNLMSFIEWNKESEIEWSDL